MYYEIYVDQLIFLDFIINTYLIYLVKIELESTVGIRKIISLSFVNAVVFAVVMLTPKIPFFIKIVFQVLVCNVIQINWIFRDVPYALRIRAYMLMHGNGMLLGGSVLALHRLIRGITDYRNIIMPEIVAVATLFCFVMKRCLHTKRKRKNVMQHAFGLEMDFYGKVYTCMGLYDSGNFLYEPCTGRPVILVEKKCVERFLDRIPPEKNYVVPYHSIGNKKGILRAVELPSLTLKTDKRKDVYEKVLVALSEQYVSKYYQAIIHPYFVDKG